MRNRVLFIRSGQIWIIAVGIVLIAAVAVFIKNGASALPVDAMPQGERVIHMVTGEFSTKTDDGREIEVYRWDPGTVIVNKGENVKLVINGVNGKSHPFIIEGLSIKGEVRKGEETIVRFHASKEGIYRIICLMHPDKNSHGPMIGYIVVD